MRGTVALLRCMRPWQYTKNLLVFAALVFAREMGNPDAVVKTVVAFVLFCMVSSAVYLINDVRDAEGDRRHPDKRDRPIACGALSPSAASTAAAVLLVAGIGGALVVNFNLGAVTAAYFVLQMLYQFALRHMVILDVFAIAGGFVLRAVAGAEAIAVEISPWLLICTLLLALFISLSKRRHELVLLENNASAHRASLTEYSAYLLDQMIGVVTASTLMAYILYTVDARTVTEFGSTRLVYTVPFVIFGIFRYLYLIHQKGEGGNPDRILLSDRPFFVNMLLWMGTVALAVYYG